jgi:hypothetical protein
MTNLSDLFPAGAGKQVSFTADGAISAAGKPVILNSAGTITQVGTSTSTQSIPASGANEPAWWDTGSGFGATYYSDFATHPTDTTKAIVVYSSSDKGYARVITRSGNTLSVGAATEFESSNKANYVSVACGKVSGQFLVYYQDGNGGNPVARVGTIDGTTCSFGNALTVISSSRPYLFIAGDPSTDNKYIVGYKNASSYVEAKVATVSGTTVTVGGGEAFSNASGPENTMACFDPATAGRFAIVSLNSTGDRPVVYQCTYSGTTVSSTVTFTDCTDDSGKDARGAYDASTGNLVITYRDKGSPYYGCVRVIEDDGTKNTKVDISSVALTAVGVRCTDIAGDPNTSTRFAVIYVDSAGDVNVRGLTTSGSSGSMTCTLESAVEITDGGVTYQDVCIDYCGSDGLFINCWCDGSSITSDSKVTVCQGVGASVTNLTSSNFLGIADGAISDDASGNVTIKGGIASSGLSSLTPASDYYVQSDGSISTTSTSPAVKIGRALSSSSINLDYQS